MLCGAASPSAATQSKEVSRLLPPSGLLCSGLREPLAVADTHPGFSWQLAPVSSQLHGVSQSAYQVEVSENSANFRTLLWTSGSVGSSAISGIVYAGPDLRAGHMYAWRVRVWDERHHPTPWSEAAHWSQAPTWHAAWIGAPNADNDKAPMPLFRKSFLLAKPPKRAILHASGLGQDELRINGRKVGVDELTPGWTEYSKTVDYNSYDVTEMLRTGSNAIGVMLGNGMYRVLETPGRYTKFVGNHGLLELTAQLHVELTDGESVDIATDGTWKTRPGPITFSSTYGGEDYDARREPKGWDEPGFDDNAWSAVRVVEGPGGVLRPEPEPPVRVMHTYTPVKVTRPVRDVLVYDLGQNFAGWPEISVSGLAGATIKLIPGELLNPDGAVSQHSSGTPQWYSYTLRGTGVERWHPRFSYYGFRYVQVEGAVTGAQPGGPAGQARLIGLVGQAVHSTSPVAGSFATSDDLLNRIHLLIVRAIENNAVSLFTDCPHREKLGWLEEAHLLAPAQLYDFDFSGLYAATARNIADTQSTSGPSAGRISEIAPQYVLFQPQWGIFDDSPEWSSTAVLAPWYLYQRTGDLHLLAEHYGVMKRYVAYLATRSKDGIIAYGLGDWYDIGPGAPGVSKLTTLGLTATAVEYQDLLVLERIAALLGKNNDSAQFRKDADAVREDFNARFFDNAHHLYDTGSQTAQAMPLSIGLVPDGEREAVLKALVDDIRAHQNHVTAGDVGFHYVVDVLLANSRADVLYDMLERTDSPSYGYQLARGATSLTEAWDTNPDSSQDHSMLGHGEEWFYRGLGGMNIDLSRSGADRLILRPYVAEKIAWVRTGYRSALGTIQSDWRRGVAETEYEFDIPVNASATIEIASASPGNVMVNGVAAAKAPGVLSVVVVAEDARLDVTSGHYRIRAANRR